MNGFSPLTLVVGAEVRRNYSEYHFGFALFCSALFRSNSVSHSIVFLYVINDTPNLTENHISADIALKIVISRIIRSNYQQILNKVLYADVVSIKKGIFYS